MSDFHLSERIGAVGLRFLNHTHEVPNSLELGFFIEGMEPYIHNKRKILWVLYV
jgi:hypothetical protein